MAQNIAGPSSARDINPDRVLKLINSIPVTPAAGCITATGGAATSNASTAAPFTLQQGCAYLIQCDVACYVGEGQTSAAAITAVNGSNATTGGFLCDPGAYGSGYLLIMRPQFSFIAIAGPATVNAKFFQLV